MQNTFEINTDDIRAKIPELNVGDRVYLTGTIYTARDQAHMAMMKLLDENKPLPFEIKDSIIYYAGPTPAKNGMATGSCGPTTSGRMDKFAPRLMNLGLAGMIGKGGRSAEVLNSIVKNGAVYFCAVGGAGALMAKCIVSMEEIAFKELGCESLKRLRVEKMPLLVGIDSKGGNIYVDGIAKYKKAE